MKPAVSPKERLPTCTKKITHSKESFRLQSSRKQSFNHLASETFPTTFVAGKNQTMRCEIPYQSPRTSPPLRVLAACQTLMSMLSLTARQLPSASAASTEPVW